MYCCAAVETNKNTRKGRWCFHDILMGFRGAAVMVLSGDYTLFAWRFHLSFRSISLCFGCATVGLSRCILFGVCMCFNYGLCTFVFSILFPLLPWYFHGTTLVLSWDFNVLLLWGFHGTFMVPPRDFGGASMVLLGETTKERTFMVPPSCFGACTE